jgi:hypothetical protein
MFLGAVEVIVNAAPDPFVVGVFSYAVTHDAGDNFKRVFKQFHRGFLFHVTRVAPYFFGRTCRSLRLRKQQSRYVPRRRLGNWRSRFHGQCGLLRSKW